MDEALLQPREGMHCKVEHSHPPEHDLSVRKHCVWRFVIMSCVFHVEGSTLASTSCLVAKVASSTWAGRQHAFKWTSTSNDTAFFTDWKTGKKNLDWAEKQLHLSSKQIMLALGLTTGFEVESSLLFLSSFEISSYYFSLKRMGALQHVCIGASRVGLVLMKVRKCRRTPWNCGYTWRWTGVKPKDSEERSVFLPAQASLQTQDYFPPGTRALSLHKYIFYNHVLYFIFQKQWF